eukprot:TRINITY_DN10610_c0_g1_i1.p1 TRINITY_DN10610_c0_g1~~TRINITY_DN10610_c0_g1_i1.p1  ORF type:complete len:196 (-),score=40.65 TRINITY_DN10610_c0_g1_i1:74-661(-)
MKVVAVVASLVLVLAVLSCTHAQDSTINFNFAGLLTGVLSNNCSVPQPDPTNCTAVAREFIDLYSEIWNYNATDAQDHAEHVDSFFEANGTLDLFGNGAASDSLSRQDLLMETFSAGSVHEVNAVMCNTTTSFVFAVTTITGNGTTHGFEFISLNTDVQTPNILSYAIAYVNEGRWPQVFGFNTNLVPVNNNQQT